MNLDDIEREFWGDQREQPTRVRLARVVKALHREMHAHPGRCWACDDNEKLFKRLLDGENGQAAVKP